MRRISKMQVGKGNFKQHLGELKAALLRCKFVSFDFEFTGLGDLSEELLDSVQDRYAKAAASVRQFTPVSLILLHPIAKLSRVKWESVCGLGMMPPAVT